MTDAKLENASIDHVHGGCDARSGGVMNPDARPIGSVGHTHDGLSVRGGGAITDARAAVRVVAGGQRAVEPR